MWFIGVEVEQETSAPPLKKNPGSAPEMPHLPCYLHPLFSSMQMWHSLLSIYIFATYLQGANLCKSIFFRPVEKPWKSQHILLEKGVQNMCSMCNLCSECPYFSPKLAMLKKEKWEVFWLSKRKLNQIWLLFSLKEQGLSPWSIVYLSGKSVEMPGFRSKSGTWVSYDSYHMYTRTS